MMLFSCEGLVPETKVDLSLTEEYASMNYTNLRNQGNRIYKYLPKGYGSFDGAMLASATDEAEFAIVGNKIEKYNLGTWNAVDSPEHIRWGDLYESIRTAKLFLRNSEGYEQTILRDTSTTVKLNEYLTQCDDLAWLRNEAKVMEAYSYFELIKRYGGVPIVDKIYELDSDVDLPRNSYDEVADHAVALIDGVLNGLQEDWNSYSSDNFGRIDKGMAMALKARILLYKASPLNNEADDVSRWQAAAQAAKAVIDMDRYSLVDNENRFLGANAHQCKDAIFSYMTGNNNTPETYNYPVTFSRGSSGNCPSGNLVDAYEMRDGTPFSWENLKPGDNPYSNRDPRLKQTVVVNNSTWNGVRMECWTSGLHVTGKQTSQTGYYLKKFLQEGLDLERGQSVVHSWPLFRYAEVLLNYAEAMNEAYGPDADTFGDGKTARWAVNLIRANAEMPAVVAGSKDEMRERIRHERRIELAFEDHRFWDVRRWGTEVAAEVLGAPLMGITITKNEDGTFSYAEKKVEDRVFAPHMVLYPIPQSEILKSNGVLVQNENW